MTRTRRTTTLILASTAVLALSTTPGVHGQSGAARGEWPTYGGDLGHTRYAPLDQITAANFGSLEVKWRFKTDNLGPRPEFNLESTPLMVGGRLYSTAGTRKSVIALDAATGELIWVHGENEGARGQAAPRQLSGRGLAYWTDGREERILYVTPGYRLVALDAKTGNPVAGFGRSGIVDLKENLDNQKLDLVNAPVGLHATPIVGGNFVLVGAAFETGANPKSRANVRGAVRAYDVRTGKLAVDLPHHSAGRRVRQRDVGERFVGLQRQHGRVGADLGGRRAGHGLPARGAADARLLRRRAPRQHALRREPRRRRSQDRRAQVALPARAPRRLGHGHPVRADPRRHRGQRTHHQGRRAAEQAGVPLRVRSRDGSADLADRRAAGAAGRRPRREVLAPRSPSPPGRRRTTGRGCRWTT